MNPQSELSKRLSIAVQALSDASKVVFPAAAHLATQELNTILAEIDALAEKKTEGDAQP